MLAQWPGHSIIWCDLVCLIQELPFATHSIKWRYFCKTFDSSSRVRLECARPSLQLSTDDTAKNYHIFIIFHWFIMHYNYYRFASNYYWNNTSIANGCRKLIRFCSLICNLLGNLMKFPIISTNFRYFPVLFLYCQFDPCEINDPWRFIDKSKDFCQFMQIFWLIDW